MRNFLFLFLLSFSAFAQDNYHLELIQSFENDNNLSAPSFVFDNTEQANLSSIYVYGSASKADQSVEGFDFTLQSTYNVPNVGANQWDAGTGISNKKTINQGDVILMTFWAKRNGTTSEVQFFVEDGVNFEKEIYQTINFTPDWNQYFVAFKANKNYPINRLATGFHLASVVQNFELAGLTGFNFGQIELDDVPSTFSTSAYEGIEDDAPWRLAAEARIEELRTADLTIKVVDANGNPIPEAEVQIEMQEHAFKFGSAFVTCRFEGNRCFNQTYVNKIFDLDGKGHGFNAGVTENALKWDGWEEEWIGTPDETVSAIKYLSDNGIRMRGHTLIWPGYNNMPDDIQQNSSDLSYLRRRLESRIEEMISHPVLSEVIREWDVLNEITQNRSLEMAFKADPEFNTGREIYQEIMAGISERDPNVKQYINDYVVLSGGGSSTSVINRYKEYLDEMHNSDYPFDGIGFQAHIGGNPTSIVKAEEVFNEFYERYGKPLSITEYDISDLVDPEVQAKYMADFLTLTFSHPAMEAFIMWGFWDGNHWKENAPMFDIDWNLKPSGQAFIDKVFDEWWTEEALVTNSEGQVAFKPFKGKHLITVRKGGEGKTIEVEVLDNNEIEVVLEGASSTSDLEANALAIFPTLSSDGRFYLKTDRSLSRVNIEIFSISGQWLNSLQDVAPDDEIRVSLKAGIYFFKLTSDQGHRIQKIVIE